MSHGVYAEKIEFIHLISTEANEISEKQKKVTITGEHIVTCLQNLGFENYIPAIKQEIAEHGVHAKVQLYPIRYILFLP